jgi:aerobic-type carbon monoxide dehydrogenase small subunit (CoxS/CutS family)
MITLTVNGKAHMVDADPKTPLLYVLRDELALNGAKFGCGLGQCGACTVMIDGAAVNSCITPVGTLQGRRVVTVEGLGTTDKPGVLQQAWRDGGGTTMTPEYDTDGQRMTGTECGNSVHLWRGQ